MLIWAVMWACPVTINYDALKDRGSQTKYREMRHLGPSSISMVDSRSSDLTFEPSQRLF